MIYTISSMSGTNLGGGFHGISAKQTVGSFKNSSDALTRRVIRDAWNNGNASGTINGHARVVGEFRAVNNLGDFLSRKDCACGYIAPGVQPDKVAWRSRIGSIIQHCDKTGVPGGGTNSKFVPDSSEYMTYLKQRAVNQNYNDLKNGGDEHHASYQSWMRVHRY